MDAYFFQLTGTLQGLCEGDEQLLCWLSGEHSDFVRFNRGKIRQAGAVSQASVRLQLIARGRQATFEQGLSFDLATDLHALRGALASLRETLGDLPEDPHLLVHPGPGTSRSVRSAQLPSAEQMSAEVVDTSAGLDLVGLLASGPMFRGFSSSLGHRHWHEATSFLLDSSVYLRDDLAIKSSRAGFSWDPTALRSLLDDARRRLPLLERPRRALSPGRYRAYLAPAAVAEILGLLSWGGFSVKALKTRQSPLVRLHEKEHALSPLITLQENTAEGLAPAFQAEGFPRPAQIALVHQGSLVSPLISPRSAKEYGLTTNGAGAAETPESLDMAGGGLADERILRELGTGLWISNLWYLNYSDRNAGRMTGMTRFATFWVENGELVAPTPVMRFDDSLYDLLGDRLEALTCAREFFPDPTTYGERQTTSVRLPGALIDGLTLTL
jgi:predicted Zn-dependent protease